MTTNEMSLEEVARRASEQAAQFAYLAWRAWATLSDEAASAARTASIHSDEFCRSEHLTRIAVRADTLRDAAYALSGVIAIMDQQAE